MKRNRDRHSASGGQGQGMHWIRPEKRLAIYLRDGLACVYCDATIEDGAKLTLDHVRCHRDGGDNGPANLVTACHRCNSARGARTLTAFARAAAAYLNHDCTTRRILAHVRSTTRRPIDTPAARELMRRRGGFRAAVAQS